MNDVEMLVRSIMRTSRKGRGQGQLTRICVCGTEFRMFDDGSNSFDLCGPCKRDRAQQEKEGLFYGV